MLYLVVRKTLKSVCGSKCFSLFFVQKMLLFTDNFNKTPHNINILNKKLILNLTKTKKFLFLV